MSGSRDPTASSLATITAHLSAAEAVLARADPDDPATACQAALAEVRLATAAHQRYLRAVSHDLRNTLTLISGQAQLLERFLAKDTLTPDRLRVALQRIDQSIAAASNIIRRLSDN